MDSKPGLTLIAAFYIFVGVFTFAGSLALLFIAIPGAVLDSSLAGILALTCLALPLTLLLTAGNFAAAAALLQRCSVARVLGLLMAFPVVFFFPPLGLVIAGAIIYYLLRDDVQAALSDSKGKAKRGQSLASSYEDYFEAI